MKKKCNNKKEGLKVIGILKTDVNGNPIGEIIPINIEEDNRITYTIQAPTKFPWNN